MVVILQRVHKQLSDKYFHLVGIAFEAHFSPGKMSKNALFMRRADAELQSEATVFAVGADVRPGPDRKGWEIRLSLRTCQIGCLRQRETSEAVWLVSVGKLGKTGICAGSRRNI